VVYGLTGVPAVMMGVNTLVSLNDKAVETTLGLFLIGLIPIRRWMQKKNLHLTLWQMCFVGAGIGYLTAIVATTGAINTPFFLAYGLTKGGFLGTEALSTLSILIAKGVAFHQLGFLNVLAISQGLLIGFFVIVGSIFPRKLSWRCLRKILVGHGVGHVDLRAFNSLDVNLMLRALQFDVRLFDQLAKAFKLLPVEFAEIFRTDVARLPAQTLQLGLHIRQLDDASQLRLKFADHLGWCA